MARRTYTVEEIAYCLDNTDSDEDLFSGDSDDQPDEDDEDSDNTEVITNLIPSSSRVVRTSGFSSTSNDCIPQLLIPRNSSTPHNLDRGWKADVLELGRGTFTGNCGVQNIDAITDDGRISLIKIYEYFVSKDLIDEMVINTNNYADLLKQTRTAQFSRMTRWRDVTREEMKTFFGVIMYMGLNPKPSIEHYWKLDALYYTPLMHKINMSHNRFTAILRCWHFTEVQIGITGVQRTHKIDPLIHKVVDNFRSLYLPSDIIVVDNPRVNPAKSDHYGMKVYKACTVNGYTWSYQIYSGVAEQLEGLDKPGSTVIRLIEPLLDQGRLIVADNLYTSIPLAVYLKERRTDLCGTLRKNRRNLPEVVVKKKLKSGEYIARQKDNLYTVLKWRNKRDVLMISTCHGNVMSNVRTKRGDVTKPDVVIDYNEANSGKDIADRLASFYSPLRKSLSWYKKIAVDLLFQVSIINARCIYNELALDSAKLSVLQVQEQIVRHLLGPAATTTETNVPQRSSFSLTPRSLVSFSSHSLQEIPRNITNNKLIRKRCSGCYVKLKAQGELARKAKQVHTECRACNKAFCLECFNEKHV